jgi:hypothetical protein
MTIVQGAAWTGVAANDLRPGVRKRIGQQMLQIAKDQAAVYEETTGIKVPQSGTIAATPHVHDGTNGAIIPIPLFSVFIGGTFYPSTGTTVRNNGGWSAVTQQLQWTPTGVTKVRYWVTCNDYIALTALRVSTLDSSQVLVGQQTFTEAAPVNGLAAGYCDVDVTGGDLTIHKLEYRTAASGVLLPEVPTSVISFVGYPFAGSGENPEPYILQGSNSLDVLVPSSTQYAPASVGYHPTQEENYADDDAISGFMCHAAAYNEGQLFELITGQAYPGKASKVWKGHNHGAAIVVNTTSSKGADMDQPLLAVNYGVRRTAVSKSDHRFDDDEAEGTNADMVGRIWCSQLTTATGTSYQTLGSYPFEMPAALAANIHGTNLLKFAALVHVSTARITSGTVRASISDATFSATGTALELTTVGGGLSILSGAIDYHGAADVAYAGAMAHLNVDAKRNTNYVASTLPTMGILSCCLYYEDA